MKMLCRLLLPVAMVAATTLLGANIAVAAVVLTGDCSPTTTWDKATTGCVGNTGAGTLTVDAGSELLSRYAYIGFADTGSGTVTIDGAGSTWTNSGPLAIGLNGSGTLNIYNGGAVNVDSTTYVPYPSLDGTGSGNIDFGANGGTLTTKGLFASAADLTGTGTILTNGLLGDFADCTYSGGIASLTMNDQVAVRVDASNSDNAVDIGVGFRATGSSMTITNGAVYSMNGFLAYHPGSSGTATVTGAGAQWNITYDLIIGSGDGTLNIQNGAVVSDNVGHIGYTEEPSDPSHGVVTVDGSGSTWNNSYGLWVGYDQNGTGTLNISNGGSVSVGGSPFSHAGTTYVGCDLQMNPTSGAINFGDGEGTLSTISLYARPDDLTGAGTINTRGLVSDVNLTFDATHGASQTIGGFGSVVVNLDLTGGTANGDLGVGYRNTAGSLTISDGTITCDRGILGYLAYSRGTALVTGSNSKWVCNDALHVGYSGQGRLFIANGADVTNLDSTLGIAPITGSGTITVSDQSTWTNYGTIYVGDAGNGKLFINSGGTVTSYAANIGNLNTANGTVTVDGNGSTWNLVFGDGPGNFAIPYLHVGLGGMGTLNITNGGLVANENIAGRVLLGYVGSAPVGEVHFGGSGGTLTARSFYASPSQLTGTNGTVLARGLVSDWNVTFDAAHPQSTIHTFYSTGGGVAVNLDMTDPNTLANLGAGYHGSSSLLIDGTPVNSTSSYLGYLSSGAGSATVTNSGSWDTGANPIYVGYNGSGTLTVQSGGSVSNGYGAYIGYNYNGTSKTSAVQVDGNNSTWNVTGGSYAPNLYVGYSNNGVLKVTNGGHVSVAGKTYVAYAGTNTGSIDFGGGTLSTTTLYAKPSQLTGAGTVVANGLVCDATLLFDSTHGLSQSVGGFGSVNMILDMSDSTNVGDLGTGYQGNGTMTINGIAVTSDKGYVGFDNGSMGVATVSGSGSWTCQDSLYVGSGKEMETSDAAGMLSILSGGTVASMSGYIGQERGTSGTVAVDAATWNVGHALFVGNLGNGVLNIQNGGTVQCKQGYVGFSAESVSVATVGNGSQWIITGDPERATAGTLSISNTGFGTLNLNSGGTVSVTCIVGAGLTKLPGGATININFDGGMLQAYDASNPDWIAQESSTGSNNLLIKQGGALFDTKSYSMGIVLPLQHGSGSPDGGVAKLGAGTLTLSGENTYNGATTVQAGTLVLVGTSTAAPGAWNTVLNLGGADIQSGKLVFDYTGGTSPAALIAGILNDSFGTSNPFSQGNGAQIYSTTAQADGKALGWGDDGSGKLTVMYTLYGDSNLDGSVNGTDLNAVLSYYNQSSEIWSHGDFNYDGSVNGTDLNTVLSNYNQSLPALTAAVPEPSTLLLMLLGLVGLLATRRVRACTHM